MNIQLRMLFMALFFMSGSVLLAAQTVISVADYGAIPNDNKNDVVEINKAIASAKAKGGSTVLNFPKGTYDIFSAGAPVKVYNVSNTITTGDASKRSGRIGLHVVGIDSIVIEGNGSLILFHNTFNNFVFDKCNNITMQNIKFDMARPSMSELTCSKINSDTDIEYDVNEDSWYSISGGKLTWVGEDGWSKPASFYNSSQGYNSKTIEVWRGAFDPVKTASTVTEISKNKIRCTYSSAKSTTVGSMFQLRNIIRSEAFGLINECSNILLKKVDVYFMHGFGLVVQYSSDITYDSLWAAPEPGTTRTSVGMADFCQFSGNKGLITVKNSHFQGANDDPINVHGTFLSVVAAPAANKIQVQFMHKESWGFKVFGVGDVIDFLKPTTNLTYATRTITGVTVDSDTKITLTLNENNPGGITLNTDVVENVTYTPDVLITDTYFAASPTRGILCTTRGNVVIKNNTFHRIPMAAIFVEDIIGGWYESGYVRNMTIYNNTFVEGGRSPITITPDNTIASSRVHRGIRILKNNFNKASGSIIIRSSSGVYMDGNVSTGTITNDFAETDVVKKLTYEAEGGTTLNGNAKIVNNDKCSDGQCVDGIGVNQLSVLTIKNVYAPSTGNYTMTVYYLCGDAKTLFVRANDGNEISKTCKTGNGTTIDTLSVAFSLNQGVGNTIKFYNNVAAAPAIDKVELVAGGIVPVALPNPLLDIHHKNPSISYCPLTKKIDFVVSVAGPVDLLVFDAKGAICKVQTVTGLGKHQVSLAGFATGIYYARARGKNMNSKQKIVVTQ